MVPPNWSKTGWQSISRPSATKNSSLFLIIFKCGKTAEISALDNSGLLPKMKIYLLIITVFIIKLKIKSVKLKIEFINFKLCTFNF